MRLPLFFPVMETTRCQHNASCGAFSLRSAQPAFSTLSPKGLETPCRPCKMQPKDPQIFAELLSWGEV